MNETLLFLLWEGRSNLSQSSHQGGIFKKRATDSSAAVVALIAGNKFHLSSLLPILNFSYLCPSCWSISCAYMAKGMLLFECVTLSSKFIYQNIMANKMAFRGGPVWGYEGRVFMTGISTFIKETLECSPDPLTAEEHYEKTPSMNEEVSPY